MVQKSFNKTKQKEIKYAVFDIETHKWIHPYAVGFFDGENYKKFLGKDCIKDFITEVARKKYRGYRIYAHNGGKFDFNFLMDVLKNRNFNVDMIFQGSRCLLLKLYTQVYRNEEGAITHSNVIQFVDSIALLKFGLDALTKDFDVKHKKLNFMDKEGSERDYEYLYRLYKEKDKRFYDYLKNDVYGLYEVIMKFKKLIMDNNGQMGMTIASTSLKTFQTGYLQKKINMTNRESNDEMKKGYYGGHTEIFRMVLPDDKYRCYDINCFSNDTKILTRNGFKKHNDLKVGEYILTLNTTNKKLEWNPIRYLHLYDYKEKLINIKTENCDILTTPNHRIYYQDYNRNIKSKNYKSWSKFKIKEIKDLSMSYTRIPTSGKYEYGHNLYSKNLIKLLAWIITEGHLLKKSNGIDIYQTDKYNYDKDIENILNSLNIDYVKRKAKRKVNFNQYTFYIKAKDGYWIKQLLNNKKEINRIWLQTWNKKDLCILFWELLKGDGRFRCQKGKCNYVSFNHNDLEKMQEICILIGKKSNIDYKNNVINIKLNRNGMFCSIGNTKKKEKEYNGKVWCVTVNNSTCVIQRNGKTCITGQSLYPSVMFDNEFPISKPKSIHNPTKTMIKEHCGITECDIITPKKLYLPVLPYKLNLGGHNKLVFPLGKFSGYWDNIQLEKAMELGYKVIPKKMMIFETDYIFKDYVTNFYKLKQNSKANTPSYILAKLMLNCWDLKTEVLTPNGWKKYNQINKGDKIYQFNKNIGKITETIVNDKIIKYSNETISLKTPHIDFNVTPEHRILYKKYKTNSKFLISKMKDLPNTSIKFKTASILNNESKGIDISNNLIKLIAWIITEGNYQFSKNGQLTMINIRQSKKVNPDNYIEIKEILKNENIKFTEHFDGCERFYINSKFSKFIKILLPDKYNIPSWIFDLNLNQKKLFIDTLIKGDGTESKGKIAYTQKWEKQIDDLQHLCSICGYSSVKGKSNNCFMLYIRKNDYSGINSFNNRYKQKSILKKHKGKIKVWCLNVDSGFVIIRRNGRVIISGQSLYGKFAQNQDSEMVVKINNPKDMVELDIVGVVDADHNLFRVKTESKGNFFIPQISIHVTALAQLRLYMFMEKLIDKGKIVSYCDTDSLFTDGYLPTSNKLGDMKKEYDFAHGYFMLPKTYCIVKKDGTVKVKAKGFTRDFQNQLNENSFRKALYKKDYSDFKITSDIEVFNSMKTSFVRHKNFVSTDFRKKSIHARYDKRKILKDFDTIPLII